MSRPLIDIANMLTPRIGPGGIDPDRLEGELGARFTAAHRTVQARRQTGEMGFFDLPADTAAADEVLAAAARRNPDGRIRDLVVLGIGGSGLGTTTLRDALGGVRFNDHGTPRDGRPRIHVLDNPDPETVRSLLGSLDPFGTLVNVVSKSGSTAETMALYLVLRRWIEERVAPEAVPDRFLFTTDPEQGVLRRIADREGIETLPVPPDVGGRFSVLTAVGLFPAAMAGFDVKGLLAGAAGMEAACRTDRLLDNPAGLLATLLHEADTALGRPIHVLMPYADRLRSFTLWFQQLWAESLGKRKDDGHVGPTPLPAIGATDQHAQVQLFMEGPHDKVVVFLATPPADDPVEIPALHPEEEALAYLGGASLAELLDVERRATAEALRRGGRPSITLELPAIDAPSMGALLMLFEVATVYGGALWGVDPLDQPGVELGKRLTYGLMGRKGHEAPGFPPPEPEWRRGKETR